MWIKFLLCGLIIAFCIALGYLAAEKYRSRRNFYAQFSSFNERYLGELSYARKPIENFLDTYEYTGDFRKTIEAVRRHEGELPKLNYLTEEERRECIDYFSMLGRGDSGSQSAFFSTKKSVLVEKKGATEAEAKHRSNLYIKLGLLAGLAFVILII